MSKYWDGNGKYQAKQDELYDRLVPAVGKSHCMAGELLRAANRVYYDAYNNGFGNNTSGAAKFLQANLLPAFPDDLELKQACKLIYGYSNTGTCVDVDEKCDAALDLIVDRVVEAIRANPQLLELETIDLFDLQDDDIELEDDEEDW